MPVIARTVSIDASSIRGDLSSGLNRALEGLSHNDHAVITFSRAKQYTLNGTVAAKCNVTLKGTGRESTEIVLNYANAKNFHSLSFFFFGGTKSHPIQVSISDLCLRLASHKGILFENSAFHAIEIYHANSVDIRRVDSYLDNAVMTNIDLRVCSNVTVEDCVISNYNNCNAGGNLWLRGEMHNVTIRGNKIVKYGNDEALAIWGRFTDAYDFKNERMTSASKENINIVDNEFVYGYNNRKKDLTQLNDMVLSVYTDFEKSHYAGTLNGLRISGNTFTINDPAKRVILLGFDPADRHRDISIDNNTFRFNFAARNLTYKNDIEINDLSQNPDAITLSGNTIESSVRITNEWGGNGQTHVVVCGGNVVMSDNTIRSCAGTALWISHPGGNVTLNDNIVSGTDLLANVISGDGITDASISATGNSFSDGTGISVNDTKRFALNFRGNTIDSNASDFFLKSLVGEGTIVFSDNVVSARGGVLFASRNSRAKITRLEVVGNTLKGTNASQWLRNSGSVGKQVVRDNQFN